MWVSPRASTMLVTSNWLLLIFVSFLDLTSTGTIGRQYLYSAPADYDQDVFNYDNDNRGTITLGEFPALFDTSYALKILNILEARQLTRSRVVSPFSYLTGEAITANAGNVVATAFRGSVKLIIGKQDSVFCGTGVDSQAVSVFLWCRRGLQIRLSWLLPISSPLSPFFLSGTRSCWWLWYWLFKYPLSFLKLLPKRS